MEGVIFLGQEFVLNKTLFSNFTRDFMRLIDQKEKQRKKYTIPVKLKETKPKANLLTIEDVLIPPRTMV